MSAAERQRRKRQRRKDGMAVWHVEGDDVAVPEMLVAAGFLPEHLADDRAAVAHALSRFVANTVEAELRHA